MANIVSRTIEVCVFRIEEESPRYLLLKRSKSERLYPGIWQFVTGMMNEGEKAVDAAIRELQEETALAADKLWVVPFVSLFYAASSDTVHMSPFFAASVGREGQVCLSAEHEAFEWCTYEGAHQKLVWPGQRQGMQLVRDYIIGGQEASRLLSL